VETDAILILAIFEMHIYETRIRPRADSDSRAITRIIAPNVPPANTKTKGTIAALYLERRYSTKAVERI
jgi:hypothetical protein